VASWSAIIRAVMPDPTSTLAVVLRHVWVVTHSIPLASRIWNSHRLTVRGSRNPPSTVPNTGSSGPTPSAARRRSTWVLAVADNVVTNLGQ